MYWFWNVHDFITHVEESLRIEWLGEEVCHIVDGGYGRNAETTLFDTFTDEVVAPFNVFRS